jgi:hypothetical protein
MDNRCTRRRGPVCLGIDEADVNTVSAQRYCRGESGGTGPTTSTELIFGSVVEAITPFFACVIQPISLLASDATAAPPV